MHEARHRTSQRGTRNDWRAAHRLGSRGRGRGFQHPRHHRPPRLRQLRVDRRPFRGGGRDRPHSSRHRRHARPPSPEPGHDRQAGPLPRCPRRRRPSRSRHRPRRLARTTTRSPASTSPPEANGWTPPCPGSARSSTAMASSSRRSAPGPRGGGPTLLVGGAVQASFERAAKYAEGWTQGGSGPDQFAQDVVKLEEAWRNEGRDGSPYKMALVYFSLGPDAQENADRDLGAYYQWLGDEIKQLIVGSAAKDADAVQAVHLRLRGSRLRRADPLPGRLGSRAGGPARRSRRPVIGTPCSRSPRVSCTRTPISREE